MIFYRAAVRAVENPQCIINRILKYINQAFENNRLQSEFSEGGYSDWLKSGETIQLDKTKNRNDAILEHKQTIIRRETVQDLNTDINTNIVGSKPKSYSAPIFSMKNSIKIAAMYYTNKKRTFFNKKSVSY